MREKNLNEKKEEKNTNSTNSTNSVILNGEKNKIIEEKKFEEIFYIGSPINNENTSKKHIKIELEKEKGYLKDIRNIIKKSVKIKTELDDKKNIVDCKIFLEQNSYKEFITINSENFIPIFHQTIEEIDFNSEFKNENENENKIKSIKEKVKTLIKVIDTYTPNYYYRKLGNIERDDLKSFIVYQKSKDEKKINVCFFENCSKEIREKGILFFNFF
jgi:hypothetical protein